jgi:hypothetical protein
MAAKGRPLLEHLHDFLRLALRDCDLDVVPDAAKEQGHVVHLLQHVVRFVEFCLVHFMSMAATDVQTIC